MVCSNESVAASKLEESQSARSDKNVHQKQSLYSNDLDQSPAIDAMLNTLLPDYFASQQAGFNSTREKTMPLTSSTLGSRMDVDVQPDRSNTEAGFISTREKTLPSISSSLLVEPSSTSGSRMDVDRSEWSNSQASLDSNRVGPMSTEGSGIELPGRVTSRSTKPKRSYKDLVNQMLNS